MTGDMSQVALADFSTPKAAWGRAYSFTGGATPVYDIKLELEAVCDGRPEGLPLFHRPGGAKVSR